MARKAFTVICLLIIACTIRAQPPALIRGLVTDSLSGAPLEDASILVENISGNIAIQRLRSNRTGFLLRRPAQGRYRIITSYLGYMTDTSTLIIKPDSLNPPIHIRLRHSDQPLAEVIVRAFIPPAIVRNDTIAFNAGAYPTRPNATVEDLLKHLPGIQIDQNGNITIQGKKVDKIFLDGKEFFLGDLKTATQNLPADIVAQIETFDSQSDQSRLSGIREVSNTKTLNIKLKNDRKKGFLGKAYAARATDNAYAIGGNAINLDPTRSLLANADANNINNQFNGKETANGPGPGLQTLSQAGLNFRNEWDKKIILTIDAGVTHARTNITTSSTRQTFLTDSSLIDNRLSTSLSENTSYHMNAALTYHLDGTNILILHSALTSQHAGISSRDTIAILNQLPVSSWLSSTGVTKNASTSKSNSLSNAIDFNHQFSKRGRTFSLNLIQSIHSQTNPSTLNSRVQPFDSSGVPLLSSLIDQQAVQQSMGKGYSISAVYTEPLNPRHILDFGYKLNASSNHTDKNSFDYDSISEQFDIPDTATSNHFYNRNTTQRLHVGYNVIGSGLRYQLGMAAQFTELLNNNYSTGADLLQHFTNWYPRASVICTLTKGHVLTLGYSGANIVPTIEQLQPIPDLSNPFLVKLGNSSLKQEFNHRLSTEYSSFNSRNFQNFQASINGFITQNHITSSTTTLPGGVQQLQYINVEGTWQLNAITTYGFPLGVRKGNGTVSVHAGYGQQPGSLNDKANITNVSSWGAILKFNYHPMEKLFLDATATADLTSNAYSQDPNQDSRTSMQTYIFEGSYEFPLAITLSTSCNFTLIASRPGPPQHQTALLNAAIYKSLLRNHSLEIRLSGFDLLDSNGNFTQTTGPNFLETNQTNFPGRLWLLSLVFRFRHFPQS